MKIRQLAVLDINDKEVAEFESGTGHARHFEVRRIGTWKQVQNDIGGGSPFRPDIVLADIDFEDDPSLQNVDFPDCGSAKPIGPLLALPYVSGRAVWAYAMYSAHFTRRASSPVMKSPWVLLPLGILLAKGQGRSFDSESLAGAPLDEAIMTIERFTRDGEWLSIGDTGSALKLAIELYSGRLMAAIESGKVRVTNSESLLKYLQSLLDEFDESDSGRLKIDPYVYLELHSDAYGVDRIQWLSMCADFVDFVRDDIDRESLEDMLGFARILFGDDSDSFQKTLDVFRVQDDAFDAEISDRRVPFHKVANELYGREPTEVRREILRLGALLANAYAWAKGRFETCAYSDIAERLGYDSSAHPYRRLFEAKGKSSLVCTQSLKVEKLDNYFNPARQTESDKLEWGESMVSDEDKVRITTFLEIFQDGSDGQHYYDLPPEIPYLRPSNS